MKEQFKGISELVYLRTDIVRRIACKHCKKAFLIFDYAGSIDRISAKVKTYFNKPRRFLGTRNVLIKNFTGIYRKSKGEEDPNILKFIKLGKKLS